MTGNWYEREQELIVLAFIDEDDNYGVDQAQIAYDEHLRVFVLMTATGCSCWDGEFDEEQFGTFGELETSLMREDRTYNPSVEGARTLIAEAQESILYKGLRMG